MNLNNYSKWISIMALSKQLNNNSIKFINLKFKKFNFNEFK